MKKRTLLAAATVAGALGLPLAATAPAYAAQSSGSTSYQATLQPVPLNGAAKSNAGGTLMLTLNGNQATITEDVHGLASTFMGNPFPHVQHIHGGAKGVCPTASLDANGDGVISTPEAAPAYGSVLTTLSVSGDSSASAATNVNIAPNGSSYHYSRTITLDSQTMQAIQNHTAVIVVHGLDPANAAPAATSAKSPLVPSLPLAATAPALCGPLVMAQMSSVPTGGAQTGAGGTAGLQNVDLLVGGSVLLLGGAALTMRRSANRASTKA